MKFRKKPVVIEARQFEDTAECRDGLVSWIRQHGRVAYAMPPIAEIRIETLEGGMAASVGDWIIRGVKGEFYPCKPDIFAATYEPEERCPEPINPHVLCEACGAVYVEGKTNRCTFCGTGLAATKECK